MEPDTEPRRSPAQRRLPLRPATSLAVELIRLAVVVLATAMAYEVATAAAVEWALAERETLVPAIIVLGAAVGYVLGGVIGRLTVRGIDIAELRLRSVSAGELLAGAFGAFAGFALGAGVTWPVLLFEGRVFTVPLAALIVVVTTTAGLRIGVARGGDLLRYLGASGRLPVTTPSHGTGVKVVDTSALIDGRLLDVCRGGFIEGTLVLPAFVLSELQGLADAGEDERRARGRRGLDVLGALQRSSGVALEVPDRDFPEITDVDAKLVALARERHAALITVDGNLASVAEVQGVKVLNLHQLAEALRPPVLPGDHLTLRIAKPGRERGQGIGYLADGTMVVVEHARDLQGQEVAAEVTSVLSNPKGRLVFATAARPPTPLSRAGGA